MLGVMVSRVPLAVRLLPLGALIVASPSLRAQGCPLELASQGLHGLEANHGTIEAALSADGRVVVFASHASNLVPGDTNGKRDIFRFDRLSNEMTRLSLTSTGRQADGDSFWPEVCGDGSVVTFTSFAGLDPRDTNGALDAYLVDVATGQLSWVGGAASDEPPNAATTVPRISADGRFVAYQSWASNLVPGDTNGTQDVFVYDRLGGRTERVSLASDGSEGDNQSTSASLSANGRFVAFGSSATNLIPGGDLNGTASDVFVRDRATGRTWLASVDHLGFQRAEGRSLYPVISGDGRRVVFHSTAGLVPGNPAGKQKDADVFVFDADKGHSRIASVNSGGALADGISFEPAISLDGRWVAYRSRATNLVPGDTNALDDVFLHDLLLGETRRVSTSATGAEANGLSLRPRLSARASVVSFDSTASNLVPNTTTVFQRVLVRDCGDGRR